MINLFERGMIHRSQVLWFVPLAVLALALSYGLVYFPFLAVTLCVGFLLFFGLFVCFDIIPLIIIVYLSLGTLTYVGLIVIGFSDSSFVVRFLPILLYYGSLGCWMLLALSKKIDLEPLKSRGFKMLVVFWLLYVLSMLFIGRVNPFHSREELIQGYLQLREGLDAIVIFIITSTLIRRREIIKWILFSLCVCVTIAIAFGVAEILLGRLLLIERGGTWASNLTFTPGYMRVAANHLDPNYLAKFLVMFFLILFPLIFYRRSPTWVLITLMVGSLGIIAFTYSGSGIISLAAGLSVLCWQRKRWFGKNLSDRNWSRRLHLLVTVMPVIFLVAIFVLGPQVGRIYYRFQGELGNFYHSTRLDMDTAAYEMFISSPVYGVGTGKFPVMYDEFRPGISYWAGEVVSHNTFMTVAAEEGVIGLVALIVMWYYLGRPLFVIRKGGDKLLELLQVGIGSTYIAFIINSFVYHRFFHPLSMAIVGMGYAVVRIRTRAQFDGKT